MGIYVQSIVALGFAHYKQLWELVLRTLRGRGCCYLLLLRFIYFIILCIGVFCLCICLCTKSVSGADRSRKTSSGCLGREL